MQTLLNSRRAFAILAALLFWLSRNDGFAANQAIISYSSRSYAFLPAQVAVAQNFFRDENLEPLLIQMRSQVTVPALISGEVQYTLSFGNIIGSAMQGLPFKILAVLTDKPLHSLVGRPEIKSINELRGKRIGTQRIGGSDQLAAEAILQAKGIDPKEVQFVTLGGDEPVRVEILKKGLVDAICTVPPGPVRLSREGYNVLGGPKDLKIGNPISAIAVTDARLKSSREETKKFCGRFCAGFASCTSKRNRQFKSWRGGCARPRTWRKTPMIRFCRRSAPMGVLATKPSNLPSNRAEQAYGRIGR
jgi:ABC-type nitrate/sulfonate/bicarbonate transport system substrate-binding protein